MQTRQSPAPLKPEEASVLHKLFIDSTGQTFYFHPTDYYDVKRAMTLYRSAANTTHGTVRYEGNVIVARLYQSLGS
jgi:hypothetical protein